MRRSIATTLILALCVSACYTVAASDLSSDQRLRQPISLQVKMALLAEVLQSITDDTGVPFTLAKELSEQKVTVFVKSKPASEVVTKLVSLLKLECEKSGDGYLLRVSEEAARLERSTAIQERMSLQSVAQTMLNRWAQYARQSLTYWKQQKDQLQQEMDQLARRQPPGWQGRRARLAEELARAEEAADPLRYVAGKMFARVPPAVKQRFWSGELLLFCTGGLPNALPLPPETPLWLDNSVGSPICFLMRYVPEQQQMVLALLNLPTEEAMKPAVQTREVDIVPEQNDSHPLLRQWQRWATPREELSRIPTLQRKIAANPSTQVGDKASDLKQTFTVSDHLQWLAERSDLSVIADAYRLPAHTDKPFSAITVADWIDRFVQQEGGYLRIEGGYLLYRHSDYWQLRLSELPEKMVREFERKARQEGLGLEDYALLAAQLQPEQQRRMQQVHGYALGFDTAPLRSALPALRFWASLSTEQKALALQRQPLYYLQLSPQQQSLFWQALQDKIAPSSNVAWLFELLSNPESAQHLAFLLERWQQTGYAASMPDVTIIAESPEELRQQLPVAEGQIATVSTQQFHFYFGFSSDNAAIYSLAIQK